VYRPIRPAPSERLRLSRDVQGLSTVEYVILLVLIAAIAVGTWRVFGNTVRCALIRAMPPAGELPEGAEQCFADEAAVAATDGVSRRALAPGARNSSSAWGCNGPSPGPSPTVIPSAKPSPTPPPPSLTPADKFVASVKAIMCPRDAASLQNLKSSKVEITVYDSITFEDEKFDGKNWVPNPFSAGGSAYEDPPGQKRIDAVLTSSTDDNAATLYHEAVHTQQPASMQHPQTEYDAYTQEEQWRIDRGLASGGHRKRDASGKDVVDQAAIRRTVDTYPGMVNAPGGGKEKVLQKLPNGKVLVKRANGTKYERAPRKNDTVGGQQVSKPPGGSRVDLNKLTC